MKKLTVVTSPEGDLQLEHVPPALAYALKELPKLLSEEFPESASRIEQDPYGDVDEDGNDERSEEWERHGHPELRHLFDSAKNLVIDDLKGLTLERIIPPLYRLAIPAENVAAWLSALAAARVGLAETHGVTPEDMERVRAALFPNPRDRGILLIQLLGWMQALLLGEDDA